MKTSLMTGALALAVLLSGPLQDLSAQETVTVNVDNYVRAESDFQIKTYAETLGAFGTLVHQRDFYSVENQLTVRVNRDTYYSFGLYDLTSPVTIIKPDPGDRFQSLMIINQDHSISPTIHEGGTFTYTEEDLRTRYMIVIFRTFADVSDSDDQRIAHALQDRIRFEQADEGTLELPNWDEESRLEMMNAINVLAGSLQTTEGFFGEKDRIDPIKHLMGTAYGYAGNPREAAIYLNRVPEYNDGATPYRVTVRDVPVDGFWSITMYDAEGYMVPNEYGAYSFNDTSAERNDDGSITIHFGGDPSRVNHLPTPEGWNTIIRLYQPRAELLEGRWEFPEFELVGR